MINEKRNVRRRTQSLTQEVAQELTEMIQSGKLKRGDRLPTESELIEQMQVSRTVVREAISHLQAHGLIETRHGIGSFVLDTPTSLNFRIAPESLETLHDIIDVLELRQSLESAAASMAALRRTDLDLEVMKKALENFQFALSKKENTADSDFEFHLAIAQATKNKYFTKFMSYLGQAVIPRTRIKIQNNNPKMMKDYLNRVHDEHLNIYQAIQSQDPVLASSAMQIHLNNSIQRLKATLSQKES
ncbi:MAG TPA: FadR family transcriptional regulator [Paenalcaligenes hominis]|mgnify:CR=1 FL=1|uniref:FadR family transcriptional regulator n=1 Tax=Paenalcaligenes hominis TaxID=643674 RepID=A0A9D2VF56_9BURK|nr:FadR/GntR family transcriptional regulator [Paenalcaligenes hominis]NJB65151.1 DNA-binding FadR family transcriptional regulator [Paenalcaligenes hominis]GGE56199.1 GntR family transcriptional regulator [Paenalcaligenes hominis]HJH23713.1 FadR family transcriptional regulator [Paenalcaligenes hominis]